MSDDLFKAKEKFKEIAKKLKRSEKLDFYAWVQQQSDEHLKNNIADKDNIENEKADILLSCIKAMLRKRLPFNAIFESENITFPSIGNDANLDSKNCIHVDAFLYDESDVDDLCDKKKLATHRCLNCESTNIDSITFITHSASKERLKFMFTKVFGDLKDKTVLDIGSRTGVVLYAAFAYSDAKNIIGIEINKEWCDVQNDIIKRFKMQDRVKIINNDVLNESAVLQKSSIIVLHNVFEWFACIRKQKSMWQYLFKNIQHGTIIAAAPPIEESIELLKLDINLEDWLQVIDIDDEQSSEETEMKFYTVMKK